MLLHTLRQSLSCRGTSEFPSLPLQFLACVAADEAAARTRALELVVVATARSVSQLQSIDQLDNANSDNYPRDLANRASMLQTSVVVMRTRPGESEL